jgi:hypothetical protein
MPRVPERPTIDGYNMIIDLESSLRGWTIRIDALHAEAALALSGRFKFGSNRVGSHWLPRSTGRLGCLLTGLLAWLLAGLVAVLNLTRCRVAWIVLS